MDIEHVLEVRFSQYQWSIVNNDYDRFNWADSNDIPKPTYQELESIYNENLFSKDSQDKVAIENRKKAIIEEWPVEKQFEALTEDAMGRPDKLNQLINYISGVKEEYPKSS
mgnify:CR=1 FL=1